MALRFNSKTGKMVGRLTRMTVAERDEINARIADGSYRVLSSHPADLDEVVEQTHKWDAMSDEERRQLMLRVRERMLQDE